MGISITNRLDVLSCSYSFEQTVITFPLYTRKTSFALNAPLFAFLLFMCHSEAVGFCINKNKIFFVVVDDKMNPQINNLV